jgi:hypothetical protein
MIDLKENLKKIVGRFNDPEELTYFLGLVLIDYAARSDKLDALAVSFEYVLDELTGNDMFGTEGQCDPRGDMRNGIFSVWEIE